MLDALAVSPISCKQRSISSALAAFTPESSRFCHTVNRISPSPRSRAMSARPRICAAVMRPTGSATPTQTSPDCFCAWTPMWAWRCWRFGSRDVLLRHARQWPAQLCLHLAEELLETPGIQHVLEARLLAVGAVAAVDVDAHDGIRHGNGVVGLHQHAGGAREVLVAGDAAETEPEPHAGLDAERLRRRSRP